VRTKPGSGRLARPICGALSGEVAAFLRARRARAAAGGFAVKKTDVLRLVLIAVLVAVVLALLVAILAWED